MLSYPSMSIGSTFPPAGLGEPIPGLPVIITLESCHVSLIDPWIMRSVTSTGLKTSPGPRSR